MFDANTVEHIHPEMGWNRGIKMESEFGSNKKMEARGAGFLKIKTVTDICWADINCVPDLPLSVYISLTSHKQPHDPIIIFMRLREVK